MLYDMIEEIDKNELMRIKGKNDLKALVFTDSILTCLRNSYSKDKILKSLKTDFFNASIEALKNLKDEVSIHDLKKCMGIEDA